MRNNGKHVTLTLTEQCNLNCVYCYEEYKSDRKMAYDTAIGIINQELEDWEAFDYVEIAFHGGEPLLEFELMKSICEYTWANSKASNYYFFATTNGTLLNDEMKAWLLQYKEKIMLGLSLDGTPEVHNHNRSGSYEQIDFDFFKTLWPNQPVKMTISDYSAERLAKATRHIHDLGFKVSSNFAFGENWVNYDAAGFDKELSILIDYYLENPSVEPCSLLTQKFDIIDADLQRWCGAGTSMKVYDVEGKQYPCHFFEGFAIGNERSKESETVDFNNDELFMDPDCEGCVLYPLCPTCYGYNYATTGDVAKRDKGLCKLTQHCIAAASMLMYRKLERYSNAELSLSEDKRKEMLHGIYVVQNYLRSMNND